MQFLKRSDLIIAENRQRREFDPDDLMDLANSIAARGLMHPIVVRETANGPVLVAGERRLRALADLDALGSVAAFNGAPIPPGEIPIVTLGDLSPLEAEEAELDENLKRKDLTWQERSEALARLHRLRTAQSPEHSLADTFDEVGIPQGSYGPARRELLLAKHLDNPEIAKAKTSDEAFKILKREEERRKSEQLAAEVGESYGSHSHSLIHNDCIAWMSALCSSETFDVILTDPPYGMGADKFGDAGGKLTGTDHQYDDSYEAWQKLMQQCADWFYRVAKEKAHAYVFCDFDRFHELRDIFRAVGWYVFRTPLVVYKLGSGRVPLPEHGPRRQYELCLYAIKGNKPVTGIYSDVIPCRLEENLAHGANKPVELYVDLLRRSTRPGDRVLDAFAGTGTIFPAAHSLKLYATGVELSPEYYGIAVERLKGLDDG